MTNSAIRIKATGAIVFSDHFKFDGEDRSIKVSHGPSYRTEPYTSEEWESVTRFSAVAQVREWYGDSAPGSIDGGRYKAKGGQEFVVWATEMEAMYGDLEAKFNEEFNRNGRHTRYEIMDSFMPYNTPQVMHWRPDAGFEEIKG
jgi:hypothetical protein